MKKVRLSKSTITLGLQCPKALWLKIHKPKLAAPIDTATQARFDQGNEVGEYARKQFPKGHLIECEYYEIDKSIDETKSAMKGNAPAIMEASFTADDLYARTDIMAKGKKGWKLIEVKMGTSAKPEYVQDASVQAIILERAGVKLESVNLMYINTNCVYPDLSNLFTTENVSDDYKSMNASLRKKIDELRLVAGKKSEPKISIGDHCSKPYDCPFKEYCWKNEKVEKPKYNSVKAKVDKEAVQSAISDWEYPLYSFDFETLMPAIPRYKGTSPYNNVPFQFSCHKLDDVKRGTREARMPKGKDASARLEHFEFLHKDSSDPRPPLIKAMLEALGTIGSIVAYNKAFEIGVIKRLADFDKKNAAKLLALIPRFVDPLPIIRSAVEHPDFINGRSLKVVAPALLGEKYDYTKLAVSEGMASQAMAEQLMRGDFKGKERERVIQELLEYCAQDTAAVVELIWYLQKASER